MPKEIFRRVEKKYILAEDKYISLLSKLKKYIKPNKFYYSTICNVYYDSDDYIIARNTIDKPVYKEKIRLRSYNIPNSNSEVYLEIKRKYKEMVGKRRISLRLNDVDELLNSNIWCNHDIQLIKEIKYSFDRYSLKPKMYIAYERYAYESIEDNDLRITFDTNLRSRDYELDMQIGDYGTPYFTDNMFLMEIKTLGSIPIWLVNILSQLQIYPIPFSKYGEIYKRKVAIDRGEKYAR